MILVNQVADQLEGSVELQQSMMKVQNRTLETQQLLLSQASDLSRDINKSSHNVHNLVEDLKVGLFLILPI